MSLRKLLRSVQEAFDFLFDIYNFKVTYTFERRYPRHIRIGLESENYPYIKLLLVHDWATSLLIGDKAANFEEENGWFDTRRIVDFLLFNTLRWRPDKINVPYKQFLLMDLRESSREFEEHCETIFELFKDEVRVDKWKYEFQQYVQAELTRKYPQLKS